MKSNLDSGTTCASWPPVFIEWSAHHSIHLRWSIPLTRGCRANTKQGKSATKYIARAKQQNEMHLKAALKERIESIVHLKLQSLQLHSSLLSLCCLHSLFFIPLSPYNSTSTQVLAFSFWASRSKRTRQGPLITLIPLSLAATWSHLRISLALLSSRVRVTRSFCSLALSSRT